MLRGRFADTSGTPYLEGRLILPRLRLQGELSFIVDTGAEASLLMPLDGQRMGIDYTALTGDSESVGIGGISHNFLERALIIFAEPRRFLYVYAIEIGIAPPSPDIMDIPSLLGRDILNRWRMIFNMPKKRLSITVLSADVVLPLTT